MGLRVYIAKITFTTLIDHFTSCMPLASVYSNQLIKFELLTQSTRQQKLPTARCSSQSSAFDPAVRMALADFFAGGHYLASENSFRLRCIISITCFNSFVNIFGVKYRKLSMTFNIFIHPVIDILIIANIVNCYIAKLTL